jgi:hypothetical protein
MRRMKRDAERRQRGLRWGRYLFGLLLLLAGCDPLRNRVAQQATAELLCPEDSVQIRGRSRGTFIAYGCGRVPRIYQCHQWDQTCASLSTAAEKRFMREYGCTKHGSAMELSPYIFGISGCGRQTTYRCRMSGGEVGCEHER